MRVREFQTGDIPQLVHLMDQLGYPTSLEKLEGRFSKIQSQPNYYTLVAELNNKVVGMVGLCHNLFYEYDSSYVRIVAFIVDHRRKGIGQKLMNEAEKWAIGQEATYIMLNSGNREERKIAHKFYLNMGYKDKSTGFSKPLGKRIIKNGKDLKL
ncbi:GNAT family N-acetyltransferase [Cytobacillus oceanisediminis]|uniref:GNAT family N-acetyltransferase n=1 Tax=Niallia alba TaxID=2729105 RepID=A0A7Y0PKQ3_9BACI|nr:MULTISPECIES: GNAT family N-acetyltransferase [Bacillaceae]MBZ9534283.1 GNAT family N-acetyltransferase [Cytobacillus oceanisediminis]NMO76098.1 GNAT family N-acetyltransferase [Niallia alba]UTI43906.1 GNAT family N-acetyltransferase [Niallia sp. RD1]